MILKSEDRLAHFLRLPRSRSFFSLTGFLMKATCFTFVMLLGAASFVPQAIAGNADADRTLGEIVVTASAQEASTKSLPAHVQVIAREDMERAGIRSLEEAFERYVPGSSRSQPGAWSNIGIRGMSSNASASSVLGDRVVLLIDGMRASTGNPAAIPFAIVERIEIVRGPSSVLYGSNAMGGAVNVITKQGKGDFHGEAGASWGRFDTAKANASLSGALNGKWGMALGGSWGKSHDYKTGRGDRFSNTAGSGADAGATVTYRNEGTRLHVTGVHRSLYDAGSPGSVTYLTPSDRVALHYSRLSAQLQTRTDAGHSVDAGLWGEENRYKFVDNGAWTPGTSRFTTDAAGTRLVGGYALGKAGRLSLGLDYIHSREKAHGTSVNQPDAINDIAGIFAEHRWEGSRLSVISGVRYDKYHGSLRSNSGIDMPRSSKSYGHMSWSTGATFWLTEWVGVKGSLGTAFVAPSAVNLAGDYVAYGWYHYLGNPDLRAETSLTGQGGLEFDWNGLHAEIMYFQTRYKDRINTVFDMGRNAYTWTNVPSQRLGGFDITAEWKGDLGGVTLAPYGHAEIFTKRHDPDNSTVSYVPHYSAVAGIGLGWKKIWLDVNARFTGTQWQTNPYTYATDKMGGFAVVNAKLTVHATDKLDLYCGVTNLTDREYAFTWGYPMPGRAVYGGFSVRY